jgi:hypothetical protein
VENNKRLFPIVYHVKHEPEGIPFEDIEKNHGVADSILILAAITQPDNRADVSCLTLDGKNGSSMGPGELFGSWLVLTSVLFEQLNAADLRKEFLYKVLKGAKDLKDVIDAGKEYLQQNPFSEDEETSDS